MIAIRQTFHGVVATAIVMIPFYIGLWIVDMGGLSGMMDDDSYPASIFLLPVIATLFSGVAFWIGVFPFAHAAKWIGNRTGLSFFKAGFLSVGSSAIVGGCFGCFFGVGGNFSAAVIYALFLGSAATVFWWTTVKMNAEPTNSADAKRRAAD